MNFGQKTLGQQTIGQKTIWPTDIWSKNIWPTDIALTFAFGQQSNGRVFDAEY